MDTLIDSDYISIDNMKIIEKKLNLIINKLEENNNNIIDINKKINNIEKYNSILINIEKLLIKLNNLINHLYNKFKLFNYFPYFYQYI